jgi:hypothetical protein
MAQNKIFISYSRTEKSYVDELLPVLRSVPNLHERLWVDALGIDIGDEFDAKIQQALTEAAVGILLLSPAFFDSWHMGIRLRRDSWVSVMYAEELNSTKSSVSLQRTDRHGILGQKSFDFQLFL